MRKRLSVVSDNVLIEGLEKATLEVAETVSIAPMPLWEYIFLTELMRPIISNKEAPRRSSASTLESRKKGEQQSCIVS